MKEAAEAARNRSSADAEKKREEFIRRSQERSAVNSAKARAGIAHLKEVQGRTGQQRVEGIQVEAAALMAEFQTAGSERRQEIERRAATLIEELKRIRQSLPSTKQ